MKIDEMKKWIDNASLEEMIYRQRYAPLGDPFFQGEIGDYFREVIAKRRADNNAAYVSASKTVGWDG